MPWQLLTGLVIGAIVGATLAAPVLGWELPDSSATMLGSALGAAAAVFGAFWLQQHEAAVRSAERREQERGQLDSLAMSLAPMLGYLKNKIPAIMNLMDGIGDKPAVPDELYDRLREPLFESMSQHLEAFQLLPLSIRYDAMQLASWGKLYNRLIDDAGFADGEAAKRIGAGYTRVVGDLNALKIILKKIQELQETILHEVGPMHDEVVRIGNEARAATQLKK